MNRLLIIGSSYTPGKPETIGGATVLFGMLTEYLSTRSDIEFHLVKANKFESRVKSMKHIISKVLKKRREYDLIFLNVSQNGFTVLFPIISFISIFISKKIAIRVFGAHGLDDLQQSKWKPIMKWSLKRASLVYMETHFLVDAFEPYTQKVNWLPNVRRAFPDLQQKPKEYQKRFVFIARIIKSKGILEALEAFEKLGSEYHFDFYGPIVEDDLNYLENHKSYKGQLSPEEVMPKLSAYDGLVLPTYFEGEGYPGIIVEAYQMGLFCITTKWRNVPEIVEQGKTGFLVPIQNAEAIVEAIEQLREEEYHSMRKEIQEYSKKFETQRVHKKLVEELLAL